MRRSDSSLGDWQFGDPLVERDGYFDLEMTGPTPRDSPNSEFCRNRQSCVAAVRRPIRAWGGFRPRKRFKMTFKPHRGGRSDECSPTISFATTLSAQEFPFSAAPRGLIVNFSAALPGAEAAPGFIRPPLCGFLSRSFNQWKLFRDALDESMKSREDSRQDDWYHDLPVR